MPGLNHRTPPPPLFDPHEAIKSPPSPGRPLAGCSLKFASSSGRRLAGHLANPSAPGLPDLQPLSSFAFPAWSPLQLPYLAFLASWHRTAAPEHRRAEGQKGWRTGRKAGLAILASAKRGDLKQVSGLKVPRGRLSPLPQTRPIRRSAPPKLHQEECNCEGAGALPGKCPPSSGDRNARPSKKRGKKNPGEAFFFFFSPQMAEIVGNL